MMTLKERIDKFVKKYPEPYQFSITLRWGRKDGIHTHTYYAKNYAKASARYYYDESFCTNTGKPFLTPNFHYDEKLGLFEIAYAVFDCKVPKKDEDRRWRYLERYFIPKGEKKIYDIDGKAGRYFVRRRSGYSYYTVSQSRFASEICGLPIYYKMFTDNFLSFIGNNNNAGHGRFVTSDNCYPWIICEWLAYKERIRTKTKTQEILDRLVAKTVDTFSEATIIRNGYGDVIPTAYLDATNNLFRCFGKDGAEKGRVYLLPNHKTVVAIKTGDGDWVPNRSFGSREFYYRVANWNEIVKLPHCGYLSEFINENHNNLCDIVSAMKHPEIEQLVNMGCSNIAKKVYNNGTSLLNDILGAPNKKKNVCAKYQVTKKQLEYVDSKMKSYTSRWGYAEYPISHEVAKLKQVLKTDAISSIDYDTFVKYFDFIANIDAYNYNTIFNNVPEGIDNKTFFLRLINFQTKNEDAITIMKDTIYNWTCLHLQNRPQQTPYTVKSYEELVRLHDVCVQLHNMQQEEQRQIWKMQQEERNRKLEEKMKKLDEKRAKLNYEDDKFIIRIPKNLAEITKEGSDLGHCVGGYTSNHAVGNTTILFLRRKESPDTSFYTIELMNSKINQIHGRYNRWLGNNPEAIPTVMRWLAKNYIECNDRILLSTATGYRDCGASLVAKPII